MTLAFCSATLIYTQKNYTEDVSSKKLIRQYRNKYDTENTINQMVIIDCDDEKPRVKCNGKKQE